MTSKEEYLPERPTPVKFTLRDRKLILGIIARQRDLASRFKAVRIRRGGILVLLSGYEMGDLMCRIERAAGRETNPKKRRNLKKLRLKFPLLFDLPSLRTATETDYWSSDED